MHIPLQRGMFLRHQCHSFGAAFSVTKEATLDNGLEVRVLLFMKTGHTNKIDTQTKA